jgi:hypothetical protein
MTSLSVRQYVVGIYRQLGLREQDVKKVQTGCVQASDPLMHSPQCNAQRTRWRSRLECASLVWALWLR